MTKWMFLRERIVRARILPPKGGVPAKRLPGSLAGLVMFLTASSGMGAQYYVATNGSDAAAGTVGAPFYNISKAANLAGPGDFIFVRGGAFNYSQTIRITNSGSPGAPIRLWAYTNEHPDLNFSAMADDGTNRGVHIVTNVNWWHIKGLEIHHAGDNGMKIEGSFHLIEQCVFHHNRDSGLQMGLGDSDADIPDRVCSNVVLNCDSYLNYDPRAEGGNADGFACKLHPGRGNAFIGCRSWKNSDDGWDLYKNEFDVLLEDCWTWHNGDPTNFNVGDVGNAGGFKLGGDTGFSGPRLVIRCIAFKNHFGGSGAGKAFHQNDHQGKIELYNCLSFSNNYNYALNNSGGQHIVKNCVSFDAFGNDHKLVSSNSAGPDEVYVSNSWNMAVSPTLADYSPLTEAAAEAPRGPDGSLPPFARLVAGSDLIDRGVNLGMAYTGNAPDLGPFEYAAAQLALLLSAPRWTNGVFQMQVSGLSAHGPVILHGSTNLTSWAPILTNGPVAGSVQLADPAAGATMRYYRMEER